MTDRYEWTQDGEGAWHAESERWLLTVAPFDVERWSWIAYLRTPGKGYSRISQSGPRISDLVQLEESKRQAIAAARAFAASVAAGIDEIDPPAPAVVDAPFIPFTPRCQVCEDKHWPHCEGGGHV